MLNKVKSDRERQILDNLIYMCNLETDLHVNSLHVNS